MYRGYVKLWRKIQKSSLWTQEKFTRGQAWIDLILLANHKPGYVRIRGIKINIARSQMAYSELTLADRWKWSRGKVRRFLKELSSNPVQQIVQQKSNLTTLISILNYEQYQGSDTDSSTADGHQTVHKQECKEGKKEYIRVKFNKKVSIPGNFCLTDNMVEYAKKKRYNKSLDTFTELFIKTCGGDTVKYKYTNWYSAWQKWLMNDIKWNPDNQDKKTRSAGF